MRVLLFSDAQAQRMTLDGEPPPDGPIVLPAGRRVLAGYLRGIPRKGGILFAVLQEAGDPASSWVVVQGVVSLAVWRYTTASPGTGWRTDEDFDDHAWQDMVPVPPLRHTSAAQLPSWVTPAHCRHGARLGFGAPDLEEAWVRCVLRVR